MIDFVHLHTHSEYSLLDGLAKIPKLVAKALQYKMKALALTDHGVMYGVVPFYLECKEKGIKPIIGCEVYMAQRSRFDKQAHVDADQYHLVLLAKNEVGYKNLMKLVTQAHLEGFYYKPRVDFELLNKYRKGLLATSACLEGEIASFFIKRQEEEAEIAAKKFLEIFADDFYLEIQAHEGLAKQDFANKKIIELSRKLGIPLVATNDIHYVEKEDAEAQDALLAVQTKKTIADENRLSMLDSPTFYLRSGQEMAALFSAYPDALKNTLKIAESCQLEIAIGKWILPHFPLPPKVTAEAYLKQLTWERLPLRFPNPSAEIKKRVDYELSVICQKGFATYFLIVADLVNWAKEQGIRVGPGRGSAAGSVVSYILRITSINPLEHGLPFERFLNPDRPTPPDIDLDFAEDRRDEVIAYVTQKYGKTKVAQIITFGTMEARGSVRDIGRVLGMPYAEPDKIAKLIPFGFTIDQALSTVYELQEIYAQPRFKKLLDLAKKVEGCTRHASTHAAGVVIADKDLTEYTPLQRESRGEKIITQYDMYALDLNISDKAIGLLKMDFLGLRNLTILQKAIDFVKQERGLTVDISEIPLDDKKVYEMLSRGETAGVFQLESAGMRRLAKNLKPARFSDIAAMVALYRPGPMELIPEFIKGKEQKDKIVYPHQDLKEILEETYGIAVYQEQCLQIANKMAGYSLAEADVLRRAIGKKKKAIMLKEKKKFIAGAQQKGYPKKTAEKVWHYIERFAGYGFNKSHSASYAMIAYQTAYMKANYPVEFMAALLTAEADNKDKIALEVEECRRMGIFVNPPDINRSQIGFTIEPHPYSLNGKAIRFGLSAIKNVGQAAISEILEKRQQKGDFKSLTDLCSRTDNQKVNKKVLESLIQVGALDSFGKRAALLSALEEIRKRIETENKNRLQGQTSLFEGLNPHKLNNLEDHLPDIKELSQTDLLMLEKNLLGFNLTPHPLSSLLQKINQRTTHKIGELTSIDEGQRIVIAGIVEEVRRVFTKRNNQEMAFVTLKDGVDKIDLVIFPKVFEKTKTFLREDKVVMVTGTLDWREEKLSLLVEDIKNAAEENIQENSEFILEIPAATPKPILQELSKLLQKYKGKDKLTLEFKIKDKVIKRLVLPYGVDYSTELKTKIKEILA